jgi:hypothetical protein
MGFLTHERFRTCKPLTALNVNRLKLFWMLTTLRVEDFNGPGIRSFLSFNQFHNLLNRYTVTADLPSYD